MENYPKHPFKLLKEVVLLVSDCTKYYKLVVILGYFIMHTMNMYAQNNISGFAEDSEGEPLTGVSVAVKKGDIQKRGTIININGFYQIKATPDTSLEFSYIGYEAQKTAVNGEGKINITLEAGNQLLGEAVVIGLAT